MAAARPLPQFDPSDVKDGQLIAKLRQLTRTVELAYGTNSTAGTGGAWYVGKGQPAAGLGGYNDLYIDVSDAQTHVVWLKTGEGWSKLGALASTDGGEANTTSNAGEGIGLALPKNDLDLPFKSLVAGSSIKIRDAGDHVVIGFTDVIDGGYFTSRKGALHLQFARGQKRGLPNVGQQGEPFFVLDSRELYFGTGTKMVPLRMAPENIIGLLTGTGVIADQYLPSSQHQANIYLVGSIGERDQIEASARDIAIVRDIGNGLSGSYVYSDQSWRSLSEPLAIVGEGVVTAEASGQTVNISINALYTTSGQMVLGRDGEPVQRGNVT